MAFEDVTDQEFQDEWAKASAEKEVSVEEPVSVEETTDSNETKDPKPEDPKPDPLAAVQASIADLARAQQQSAGQVADQLKQIKAEAEVAKSSTAKAGPSEAEIAAAQKDPEEWDRIKAENPEWASAIEKVVEHRLKSVPKIDIEQITRDIEARIRAGLRADVTPIIQSTLTTQGEETKRQMQAYQAVEEVHPAWTKTIATTEFTDWKKNQAPGIRALFNSDEPADAIQMLNLYVGSKPTEKPSSTADQVAAERQAKLSRSVLPSGGSTPRVRVDTSNSTWEDDWELLSKLKQAQQARA